MTLPLKSRLTLEELQQRLHRVSGEWPKEEDIFDYVISGELDCYIDLELVESAAHRFSPGREAIEAKDKVILKERISAFHAGFYRVVGLKDLSSVENEDGVADTFYPTIGSALRAAGVAEFLPRYGKVLNTDWNIVPDADETIPFWFRLQYFEVNGFSVEVEQFVAYEDGHQEDSFFRLDRIPGPLCPVDHIDGVGVDLLIHRGDKIFMFPSSSVREFERRHSLHSHPKEKVGGKGAEKTGYLHEAGKCTAIGSKEEENLYRTIGALAEALADRLGAAGRRGGKVNSSELARYLIGVDENGNEQPSSRHAERPLVGIHGMRNRSLRDRIDKGLKAIDDAHKDRD